MKTVKIRTLSIVLAMMLIALSVFIPLPLIADEDNSIDYSTFNGRKSWLFNKSPSEENFQVNMLNAAVDTDKGYFYAPTNWTQTQPVNYEFKTGHRYVVNFKWKVSAKPTEGFQLQLKSNDTVFKNYGWMSTTPTDWQTDRISFTATNTGLLKIYMNAGTGQTFYVDTVSVYEVGTPVRFDFNDDTQILAKYADKSKNFDVSVNDKNTLSVNVATQWSTNCQFVPDYLLEFGKKYEVTFRYKSSVVSSSNIVNIFYNNGSGKWDGFQGNATSGGFAQPTLKTSNKDDWNTTMFSFVSANDETHPYLSFVFRSTAAGQYEIDDITINEVIPPNIGKIVYDTKDGNTREADLTSYTAGQDFYLETPTRKGHEFEGWYTEDTFENKVEKVTVPEKDKTVTVYAKWSVKPKYELDFEKSTDLEVGASWYAGQGCNPVISKLGDNNVLSVKGSKDLSASSGRFPVYLVPGTYKYSFKYRANPVAKGDKYSFSFIVANNTATDNTTLSAGKKICSVFDFAVISTDEKFENVSGTFEITDAMLSDTASALGFMIKTAKYEDMFYLDDLKVEKVTPIKVEFESNGGDEVAEIMTSKGEIIELPDIMKSGYVLDGWYNSDYSKKYGNAGEKFTVPDISESMKLYASWKENKKWLIDFEKSKDLEIGTSWFANYQPKIVLEDSNHSLEFKGNKDNANSIARLSIPLSAGKQYSYSFDYKTLPLEEGDSYYAALLVVDKKATDNTGLDKGTRLSTPLSFVKVNTNGEYKNIFGTFTVPNDLDSNKNRLAIAVKTSKQDDMIWFDNILVQEIEEASYSSSKTYDFDNPQGIVTPAAGTSLSDGSLVFNSDWAKYMCLDYILKDNQAYSITVYYKVELKEGQDYQSFRFLYDYGTSSSHDYKTQTISNSGWISGNNKDYTDLVNTFTVKPTGIEDGKCFFWLGFDADPGTAKDSAKKGGGKIVIDKIVISEKDQLKYAPQKTFNFDDKGELLSVPSGSEVKNSTMIFPCSWGKWLGLQYLLKNDQDYEMTVKYKVQLAPGQKSQSVNLAAAYGTESNKVKNITDFGWQQFSNTEYDTFVAKFKITPNMVSAGSNYLWLYLNANPGTEGPDDALKGGGKLIIDSITVKEAKPIVPVKKKTWTFDDKSDLLSIPSLATVKDGALVDKCGWGQNLGMAYIFEPNRTYQITVKYKVNTPNQSLHLVLYSGSLTSKKNKMGTVINWKRVSDTSYTTLEYEVDTNEEMFEGGYYYMWLYLNNDPEYGGYFYIDEITVENMGPLDYRLYGDAIENYEWKPFDEDVVYGDWKNWSMSNLNTEKTANFDDKNTSKAFLIYVIGGAALVLIAGAGLFIVKKKKSKKV